MLRDVGRPPPSVAPILAKAYLEPDRCRRLHRLRNFADAAHPVAPPQQQQRPGAVPPPPPQWAQDRLAQGRALPSVSISEEAGDGGGYAAKRLAVTAAFALCVGEDGKGLPPELFGELMEYMVPEWDAASQGKPFGEGNHEPEAVSEAKARTVLQAITLARLEAVLGRVFEGLLPGGL